MAPRSDPMPVAGLVTGLAVEAAILRRLANFSHPDRLSFIACAGADTGRARQAAQQLLAKGAEVLVSFGVAGGLDPALRPGALLLPERVGGNSGLAVTVDATWRRYLVDRLTRGDRLAQSGLEAAGGVLVSTPGMVATPADKRRLRHDSGAVAVDMESHAVALVAAAAGVPFVALRAVADPAERSLPAALLDAIAADGRPRVGRLVARLSRRPWQVPAVFRLRRDLRAALATLRQTTEVLEHELFGG